jgi:2-dehydro-3-deoxygluconokinase
MTAARRHGAIVSYDLNYRASLWSAFGGQARARQVNRRLVEQVDVLIGNEEDFTAALGFEVPGLGRDLVDLEVTGFSAMIDDVVNEYPHLQVVATTLREVHSASRNDWSAVAWADGTLHQATRRLDLEIFDRVGGGDSFASGLIYGLQQGLGVEAAVEYGAAHGALAMTTPGDTSMATLAEVQRLAAGGGARVVR